MYHDFLEESMRLLEYPKCGKLAFWRRLPFAWLAYKAKAWLAGECSGLYKMVFVHSAWYGFRKKLEAKEAKILEAKENARRRLEAMIIRAKGQATKELEKAIDDSLFHDAQLLDRGCARCKKEDKGGTNGLRFA